MNKIFKKKIKDESVAAPEEPETAGEIKHIEKLADSPSEIPKAATSPEYREYPVCMSQTQINNLVIENNFILKENNLILKEILKRTNG